MPLVPGDMLGSEVSPVDGFESRLAAAAHAVQEQAAECERRREFTPGVLELLRNGSLLRAWISREFGGAELGLPASLRLFEGASRLDGSFGWAVTIGVGGGLFSATMQPGFAREVFGPLDGVIAGSGAAGGNAREVPGGYRVTGRWPYASGSQHATWFTAGVVICDDAGLPVKGADGHRLIRAIALEPGQVRVLDTWDALGMRATTSHDFEVHDAFVPIGRVFDVLGEPRAPGPLFRFPFLGIAEMSFAAVALGVASHGIEAFRKLSVEKRLHYSGEPLHENSAARSTLGEAEVAVATARDTLYSEAERAWDAVVNHGALDDGAGSRITAASVTAAEACARALDVLYPLTGMSALFRASEFGRCWRDLHTVAQHGLLTPARLPDPRVAAP